jgi:hypothetical protein
VSLSTVLTGSPAGPASARRAAYEYDRRSTLGRLLQTACVESASVALAAAPRGWVVASVDVEVEVGGADRVRVPGRSKPPGWRRPAVETLWFGGGRPVRVEELAGVAARHPQGLPGALVSGSIRSVGRGESDDAAEADVSCVRLHFLPAGKATTTYVRLRVVGVDGRG